MKKLFISLLLILTDVLFAQTATWTALGTGLNSNGNAIAVSGTNIYVGGGSSLSSAGGTAVNALAIWNGTNWSALSTQLNAGSIVSSIAVSGTDIYVAGSFTSIGALTVNNIAKWNGTNWSALGTSGNEGVNASVYNIAIQGNKIVVGGAFLKNGSYGIAIYDISTSTWTGLGSGLNNFVYTVAYDGTNVFAGGTFTYAGGTLASSHTDGVAANYIAKWDGANWSALSTGVNSTVSTISFSGTDIYVGGQFSTAGGTTVNKIAKWNGIAWSALGSGLSDNVSSIVVYGTDVYVGGSFITANGSVTVNGIAKWSGTTWSALGVGVKNPNLGGVQALAVSTSTGKMIVGGGFGYLNDDTQVNYIARFSDASNPLPVELTSFTANVTGFSVSLNWQTATEVNNYGFNVELKIENGEWKSLAFIQGHGNSNSPKSYSFVDPSPPCGVVQYRLKQIDFDGKFDYSDIVQVNVDAPTKIELRQNHPNPFNPETTISFKIQAASYVTLKVHDILGREVATLVDELKQPGIYNSQFSIRNSQNGSLRDQFPSGVYFYTLRAGNYANTKKMILMK